MSRGLISFAFFLLVFSGCSRHRDHQRAETRKSPESANGAVAAPQSLTKVSAAQDPATTAVARPSPFSPDADRQAVAPPTVSTPDPAPAPLEKTDRESRKPVVPRSRIQKPLKPFVQTADISHDRPPVLPGAPVLPPAGLNPASAVPFGARPCCLGKATYRAAKPAGLQRVLRALPGIRRIRQSPESVAGYVAPRPAHDITLVLPPQARAILPNGGMDLKAMVDENGHVTRVELLSPKDEELVRLAAYAAGEWPFTPARVNDTPVPSEVLLHFTFTGN